MGCNTSKKKQEKERKRQEKEEEPPEASTSSGSTSATSIEPSKTQPNQEEMEVQTLASKKSSIQPNSLPGDSKAAASNSPKRGSKTTANSIGSSAYGATNSNIASLTAEQLEKFKLQMSNVSTAEKLKSVLRATKSVRPSDGHLDSFESKSISSHESQNSQSSGNYCRSNQSAHLLYDSQSSQRDGFGSYSQSSQLSAEWTLDGSVPSYYSKESQSTGMSNRSGAKSVTSKADSAHVSIGSHKDGQKKTNKRRELPLRPLTCDQKIELDRLSEYQKRLNATLSGILNAQVPAINTKAVVRSHQQPEKARKALPTTNQKLVERRDSNSIKTNPQTQSLANAVKSGSMKMYKSVNSHGSEEGAGEKATLKESEICGPK